MNPERWERVAIVYQAALDHPPADRDGFVAGACNGDEDLRREVQSLLAEDASKSPLDDSVWETAADLLGDVPDLVPGSSLGPYRIDGVLGIGGMGEVYRATDTRLDRTVAIKILPRAFSTDRTFRDRFEREAKAIAALRHPHICVLYDVGRERVQSPANDELHAVDFLVLEHVEGETVAARLRRGALPAPEALRYAREIADALAAAHRRGMVHRDLKPSNIMITGTGAKLLDFGLAKASSAAPDELATVKVARDARDATATGAILGTPQYMAPEQLDGAPTDARSDIYSFGAVVYEMFTGRKASVSSAEPLALPVLDRIVRRCLARDPDERWQSAADLARELESAEEGSVRAARRGSRLAATGVMAALVLLGVASAFWYLRRAPAVERTYRVSVVLPEGSSVIPIGPSSRFSLSPDGQRLAFVAARDDGRPRLYLRMLDRVEFTELPGTEGAILPFWSPDGRSLGFISNGELKRIDLDGHAIRTLARQAAAAPGAWSRDGVILFTPTRSSGLSRVSASGGDVTPVTMPEERIAEMAHVAPAFLPDGRHFFYLALTRTPSGRSAASATYVASLDDPASRRPVLTQGSNVAYANGHLVFASASNLMAQPFDVARLERTGSAAMIVGEITRGGYFAFGQSSAFSVSDQGTIAYQTGQPAVELAWLDRGGRKLATIGEPLPPDAFADVHLSRDGRLVAVNSYDLANQATDIWRYDIEGGGKTQLTAEPTDDLAPVISADGARLVFASQRRGHLDLFQRPAVGGGQDEVLLADDREKYPMGWSPDRGLLLFIVNPPGELRALPLAGNRNPFSVLPGTRGVQSAQLSPDGRWILYASTESGRSELYATEFPNARTRTPLTTSGGDHPRWRADGQEIFFRSSGMLMAADVVRGAGTVALANPRPLFDIRQAIGAGGPSRYFYDVTADGQRFLIGMRTLVGEQSVRPGEVAGSITLLVNWPATLTDSSRTR